MDNIQDEIELDIENNRTVFLKESDPFLPIIPSPGIQEKPLEERLKTSSATPIHSPHVSPLFTPHNGSRRCEHFPACNSFIITTTQSEPSTSIRIEHFGVPPVLLVRPVPLSVGSRRCEHFTPHNGSRRCEPVSPLYLSTPHSNSRRCEHFPACKSFIHTTQLQQEMWTLPSL